MSLAEAAQPLDETDHTVAASALDRIFRSARTYARWSSRSVAESVLHELYELLSLGPTSANCSPARFVFLCSRESREQLRPALSAGNVEKVMSAPITVIVAFDPVFYDRLGTLYPHADARTWFAGNNALAEETAFRNGTLQGGYLILAARSLGLDAGPMSGFDAHMIDDTILAAEGWRANFLVNLGYGEPAGLRPRDPRLPFDDACRIL